MDCAYIYGTFQFVGFHLCSYLLNSGWEVIGIDLAEEQEGVYGDKRMEIGRNSNFQEVDGGDIAVFLEKSPPDTIIVSLYDYYMGKKEDEMLSDENLNRLMMEVSSQKEEGTHIVFLLPIQMLLEDREKETEHVVSYVKKYKTISNTTYVYLPSLYGPWQPSSYVSKALINAGISKETILDGPLEASREWMGDILYVEDALTLIIERIENNSKGAYLLESGIKEYWVKCFNDSIEKNPSLKTKIFQKVEERDVLTLRPSKNIPFADGALKQVEHEAIINSGR